MEISRSKALVGVPPHLFTFGLGLFFVCRLQPAAALDPWAWTAWLALWGLSLLIVDRSIRRIAARHAPTVLLAVWLLGWYFSDTARAWQFPWLGGSTALGVAARQGWLQCARLNHSVRAEALRWLLLGLAALGVLHPFVTPSLVGGGDARMYAQLLADCLAQLHAGVIPVLVGQSDYAFNGDIHPLRTAPGFFYAGGLLDLLTLRALPAVAVQNVLIVLSGLAAVFITYLALVRLVPRNGWIACLLTLLFLSSPGVLAPLYSGDMVASWMTLPWLPLFFFAAIRMADRPAELRWPVQAAAALAALWLFHAPIGFWVSVCALPFVIRQVAVHGLTPRRLFESAGVLGLFGLLGGAVFVSVATLDMPGDPNLRPAIDAGAIRASLQQSWQGFFRPVSPSATALLSDLQLSPGLWLALALGLMCLGRVARVSAWLLGAGILFLTLMLLPPLDPLWRTLPDLVLTTTEKWPAQRFFIILSVAVPFLALPALASFRFTHRRFLKDAGIVLVLACAWSLLESTKFIRRGWAITLPPALTRQQFLPENVRLSRYGYEYYGRLPRYHSHGPVEPLSQTRLLAVDTLEPSVTNAARLLAAGAHPGEINFTYEATDYGGRFIPRLHLPPGERYLLHFDFQDARPQGVIQVAGRDLSAEYFLPDSGEERAFGAGSGRDPTLTLWHREAAPDAVEIKFVRTPDQSTDLPAPRLKALPFASADLPLQLHGLIPFRLTVRSESPAWLETPKLFLPGYRARVDGHRVPVALSPDGLVMLPVPAGVSQVELAYPGPFALRAVFWVGVAAWLMLAAYLLLPATNLFRRALPAYGQWLMPLGRLTATGVLTVVLLGGGRLAWLNLHSSPTTLQGDARITFTRHFPIGRAPGTVETLVPVTLGPYGGDLVLNCVDGKRASIGFRRRDGAPVFGDPFPVNYLAKQNLELRLSADNPAALQVRVNERLVLNLPGSATTR